MSPRGMAFPLMRYKSFVKGAKRLPIIFSRLNALLRGKKQAKVTYCMKLAILISRDAYYQFCKNSPTVCMIFPMHVLQMCFGYSTLRKWIWLFVSTIFMLMFGNNLGSLLWTVSVMTKIFFCNIFFFYEKSQTGLYSLVRSYEFWRENPKN